MPNMSQMSSPLCCQSFLMATHFVAMAEGVVTQWNNPCPLLSFNSPNLLKIVYFTQTHSHVTYCFFHTQQIFGHEFHFLALLFWNRKMPYISLLFFPGSIVMLDTHMTHLCHFNRSNRHMTQWWLLVLFLPDSLQRALLKIHFPALKKSIPWSLFSLSHFDCPL